MSVIGVECTEEVYGMLMERWLEADRRYSREEGRIVRILGFIVEGMAIHYVLRR